MSTHYHHLSQYPTITTVTDNASAISAQQQQKKEQQLSSDSANGKLSVTTITTAKSYPSATASYEGVTQSPDLFWEKLKAFHQLFETKFMVPSVGGKPLDLHHLFVEVTSQGGLEKVYYFHKQVPSISMPGNPVSRNLVNGSAALAEGATRDELPAAATILPHGCSVTGTIDGKFENGYLVTVNMGTDQMKGVLYHIPQHVSKNSYSSANPTRRDRKRSRLALRDPSRPKSNRSGYNFFFAEHYARLKPLYYGEEKAISKKIGLLWSNLTEAEKQVYQEKGLRDKERYRTEMLEYKSSYDSTTH
ncbi:high mobility group B protein 10 isoform X4 [Juglans microcarpa x Juglans regia]|uniref:high mobility group B protein 10 isoform X4 n=1 Tax=Juglans microcarpa x Juglans regia TaxID=2249226 RepID=UPI001B7EF008|nr:high mobility group B protein 10 isoform X4 [Juglans microcarpa x Juglans regia]